MLFGKAVLIMLLSNALVSTATIFIWVFVSNFIFWPTFKKIIGTRISKEDEYRGAGIAECGMEMHSQLA